MSVVATGSAGVPARIQPGTATASKRVTTSTGISAGSHGVVHGASACTTFSKVKGYNVVFVLL